jgi:two-component system LytT family response regulator
MPKLDGFGVLAEIGIGKVPWVVFVTAYDEFAVRAFESQALDYLLKPWSPPRLQKVLERIRAERAERQPSDIDGRLEHLLQTLGRPVMPSSARLTRLLVEKGEEREILLAVGKIDWVRANGNVLRFFTRDGVFARRMTLTELETRLDPEQFLRINRSELVRLDAVAEVQPLFHGESRVVLNDGQLLTWSRRYRARSVDRF